LKGTPSSSGVGIRSKGICVAFRVVDRVQGTSNNDDFYVGSIVGAAGFRAWKRARRRQRLVLVQFGNERRSGTVVQSLAGKLVGIAFVGSQKSAYPVRLGSSGRSVFMAHLVAA
jgi:hypothetical protein